MNKRANSTKSDSKRAEVHWSEWLAGALSALLIVALLGFLGYQSYQYQPDKADFRVEVTNFSAVENGYRVAFSVFNLTRSSAARAGCRNCGRTARGGEQAEATFDYVASKAQTKGALFFAKDPRNQDLKLRVESYIDP
ncbi:TIGR02588 family protein [Ochrobactrum pseudogrignonense]|nr:TIGR02588 family protein [Brucella pseudogrignonensis]